MSLNCLQRIIAVLALLVVGVMCLFPPWQAAWAFVGVGTRVGFCYAPVWFDGINIVNKAAAAELTTLQAKYDADSQDYQSELAAWQEAEKSRKEAALKPTAGSPAPTPEAVPAKGKAGQYATPEEVAYVRKWLDELPGPPPLKPRNPTLEPKPGIMQKGGFVQLQMDRLLLQLGVVVALSLAGIVATGNRQVREAGTRRRDADRIDETRTPMNRT